MAVGCSKFLKKTQWEKIVMCILRKVFIGLTQNFDRNTPLYTSFTNSIYVTHFWFVSVEMFSILVFRFRFSNEANSKNIIFFTPEQQGNTPPGTPFKKNIYLTHFTALSPEILRFKKFHFYHCKKKFLND